MAAERMAALATVSIIEEVARECVTASLIPAVNKLGSMPVLLGGTEELKMRYLTAQPPPSDRCEDVVGSAHDIHVRDPMSPSHASSTTSSMGSL